MLDANICCGSGFFFVGLTGSVIYPFVFGAQWQVAGQTAQIYRGGGRFICDGTLRKIGLDCECLVVWAKLALGKARHDAKCDLYL